MQRGELPQKVILFKSLHPQQEILKKYLTEWNIDFIEAEYFAQIRQPQIIEDCSCVLAIIEDQKGVEFLRAIMHYYTWTQRIMLAEKPEPELLEAAINRAHVNYFLHLPLVKKELHTYLIKATRRFKNLISPINKFEALSDLTVDLLEDNQRFRKESQKDDLTGLLNRRSFNLYMENLWHAFLKKRQIFSLAMLDIDHFKKINDRYGHPAGDEVLKQFGQLLNNNLRTEQDFAFRVGGEEFALISIESKKDKMAKYVKRVLNIVRNLEVVVDEEKIKFTFSAGVADVTQVTGPQELIKKADEALYQAKNNGRNLIVLYEKD